MPSNLCNCKFRLVDPGRHEPNCNVVLTARLHQKERALAELERLLPFPGLETFHQASIFSIKRDIKALQKRLNLKG